MGWVFKQILCPLYEKYNYIYSFRVTFLQLVTITLLKMSKKHVNPSAKYFNAFWPSVHAKIVESRWFSNENVSISKTLQEPICRHILSGWTVKSKAF